MSPLFAIHPVMHRHRFLLCTRVYANAHKKRCTLLKYCRQNRACKSERNTDGPKYFDSFWSKKKKSQTSASDESHWQRKNLQSWGFCFGPNHVCNSQCPDQWRVTENNKWAFIWADYTKIWIPIYFSLFFTKKALNSISSKGVMKSWTHVLDIHPSIFNGCFSMSSGSWGSAGSQLSKSI